MKPTIPIIAALISITGCAGITDGINVSYTKPIGNTGKEVTAFLGGGTAGVIFKMPKKIEAQK